MGAQFQVDVNVTTHGAEKVDQLERKLKEMQNKSVDLKVNVEGLDKINTSNINKQMKIAGEQASKSFSQGLKSAKNSIFAPIDYTKTQNQVKKANDAVIKENARTQQQIQRQQEKNIAQTQKNQQSWNRIQAQQTLARKTSAIQQRNAHNEELMSPIKETIQRYQNQAKQLAKIQQRINSGEFEARNAKTDKFLSRYNGQDSEFLTKARKYASELKSLQSELQSGVYSSGDKKGLKIVDSDQIKLMDQIDEKAKQLKNSFTEISNIESKTLGQGIAERGANKIAAYYEANSKAVKKYGASLKELESQYRNAKTVEDKSNVENAFSSLKSRISAEGLSGNSNWEETKRAITQIGQFAGVYGILQNTVMQVPSQMIQAVKDYDSAMVDMQMATGISNTQTKELMNTYSDMGKQLKVTGVDVATSATEWMKQGKSIEESNKLAQDSIVLSRIGDLSSDDATKTITAAMKSYNLNESQVMDFIDQISAIDMASATDVGGLADAFNEVAANANQAGISTKQLLSYAAVIGETTQEGMSSVGTSLNAIFSRMGNIKLARLKDYQNGGEDLSNVETVLKGVGISLRDSDGEFKNFGDVLDDTAAKWSEFGSVQQRAVSQAFAG